MPVYLTLSHLGHFLQCPWVNIEVEQERRKKHQDSKYYPTNASFQDDDAGGRPPGAASPRSTHWLLPTRPMGRPRRPSRCSSRWSRSKRRRWRQTTWTGSPCSTYFLTFYNRPDSKSWLQLLAIIAIIERLL
jgi:hypothetical protein